MIDPTDAVVIIFIALSVAAFYLVWRREVRDERDRRMRRRLRT